MAMVNGMQGAPRWLDAARQGPGPAYARLANAIEAAIRSGDLQPGERLPPQRSLATLLGVDLTTVTRALNTAGERGLVEGVVGRGTFVRRQQEDGLSGAVDLSMTLPPPPLGISLGVLLAETVKEITAATDPAAMMAYHPGAGSTLQRSAAAVWLEPFLGDVSEARMRICAGAQTALAAILLTLGREHDLLVTESLVYPGLLTAAEQAGLQIVSCSADTQGLDPEALARLISGRRAIVALCPTLQNPTGLTIEPARRRELARVIREARSTLIEDDAYGSLPAKPPPAIASFVPERAYYIATVSKCISPGLRYAAVVSPTPETADRLTDTLRTVSLMASPLTSAIVTTWMRNGTADKLVAAVRAEAKARRALAQEITPRAVGGAASLHVWFDLPDAAAEARFLSQARSRGLSVASSETFRSGEINRPGVRVSLGGPARREALKTALGTLTTISPDVRRSEDIV